MTKIRSEIIRRVYFPDEGAALDVGTDLDYGTMVEIRNSDPASTAFFGNIYLTMTPDYAEALGAALISVAHELRKN